MAKEATNPKPSMQREWYCLAVHKNTYKHTFEYVGAEKQTAEKVGFRHLSSSSGNRTPGSRFYSNLWIPQFVSTSSYSSVVQVLGCTHNCRRLTYGSFRLTHMSHDDHAAQLIEPWQPKRRQNIITALTTLPQRWVLTRKHQYMTAITTMCTESSWAFPDSYTADESWAATGRQKGS